MILWYFNNEYYLIECCSKKISINNIFKEENYANFFGENKSDYVVSDTFYGTGAHEAGHAVINGLLRKVPIEGDAKSENLKIAAARSKGKLEHEILKEAKKRYGSNPPISKYGSTKESEKIAEAVSDVYSNKNKANPYSKVIVGVMKDINSGTFNPKLKVSRREMGI